jgi:hypothetical protein
MKGYVYLDVDNELIIKDKNYIDNINPLFWSENGGFIVKKWAFDTDEPSIMKTILIDFKTLQMKKQLALRFLDAIGFDPATLRMPPDETSV